jgi:micrococcal nuclease
MPHHAQHRLLWTLTVGVLAGGGVCGCDVAGSVSGTPGDSFDSGTVSEVVDGDTVHVDTAHHDEVEVRILGIDTPETRHPDKPVQCWGPQASDFAHETLDGEAVTLYTDPGQDATDRYDRVLAYVELADGTDYSVAAAEAGAAKAYIYNDKPVARYDEIEAAERDAKDKRKGLWGKPCNGDTESGDPNAESGADDEHYESCQDAESAGAAPLHKGDPGYRPDLDGDNDGTACD